MMRKCPTLTHSLTHTFRESRLNRVPEDEWMRRDAEANAAAFYYHQQQSTDDYVLTDDEVKGFFIFS